MKREDVVGRKITRLMRDEIVVERGSPIDGISDGVYQLFHVFLELDGRDLMEVGQDRRFYPLAFVSNDIRGHLTDITLAQDSTGCIGEVITDVMALYENPRLRLSSGRYFWVEDAFQGTEVCLERPEDVAEEALMDYWAPSRQGPSGSERR